MNTCLYRLFSPCATAWRSRERLITWGRRESWTVGLSYEGSIHVGASGSGKTSGGIAPQTLAMMRAGYGILFLTTKGTRQSDADLCIELAEKSGRTNSIVRVGPGIDLGFNLLREEMRSSRGAEGSQGDMSANVASLFSSAAELALPRRDNRGGEPIWRQAVESLVRHAVTLVYNATGDLRLDDLVAVVKSAPPSTALVNDAAWRRESTCIQLLERVATLCETHRNVWLAREYFLKEFPSYPPDTRNSVTFTFGAGCADLFQREPLRSMFFGDTDYTPDILLDGAILLCDCPVLENREVGQIANGLLRLSCQRMLERRARHPSQRPVGIIWDEAQKTLLRSDVAFQETARSARCATVAATQHLPALQDAVGEQLAATFFGNLRSKLFFQNNEPSTGEYMRRLAGKTERVHKSKARGADGKVTITKSPVEEDALPAHAAHNLKTGGPENRFIVTGLLIVGSKKLQSGVPYQLVRIAQRKLTGWSIFRRARVVATQRPCADFRYLRRNI